MSLDAEDFYVQNGNFVWTEKFLKKRGYCCNNGCRHCPYKKQKDEPINDNQQADDSSTKERFWLSLIVD